MAKKKAKQKKKAFRLTSSLRQHKQVGKSLIPPMLTIPGVTPQSWTNDRLPQMLWACLVISILPRRDALAVFREIASIGLRDGAKITPRFAFIAGVPSSSTVAGAFQRQ